MASETNESDSVGVSPLIRSSHFARGHPIHSMAPEILGEIFIRCLPYPSNPTSFKDAPLLLLHVCCHWRETARGTPSLWTDLSLTLKLQPATVFQMWLDNSGSLPLKVSPPGHSRDPKRNEDIIDLLLNNFHRISELEGSLTQSFAKILLEHPLPIRAPLLKRLDVDGWDKLPSLSDLERLRRCIIVPQLECFYLNSSRFQLPLLSLDPTRLKDLYDLWVIEVAEFESMEILISFTNLQTLRIFLHPPVNVSVLKIPSVIPILSLRHLHIGTFTGYDPNLFLRALDAPFIEHLELQSSQIGDSPIGPLLDALTGGNIPPLKSLILSGYNITASDLMLWIRRFTQLEDLSLERGTLDGEALISLICDASSSPDLWICPVLTTLHLRRITFPWMAMEDLVQSRAPKRDTEGCLRKLIFEAYEELEEPRRAAFTRRIQECYSGSIQIDFIPDRRKNQHRW